MLLRMPVKRKATLPLPFEPRSVDLPPLSVRADVVPETFDEEERTVVLGFTTGAAVERYDWMSGQRYVETLSLDPAHVRLDRLNQGAPLLDAHSAWSVSDILGATVPGTATLGKKEGRVTVRFSKRDAVEPVWQDVKDKIIRSVSMGYRVYKFEETVKGNALPVRKAVDWEPFEVSMVPIPADAGAGTRGQRPADTNQCEVVTRAADAGPDKEIPMPRPKSDPEFIDEGRASETPPAPTPTPAEEPNERDAGVAAERTRCQGITLACRAARLPQSFADKLVNEGVALVAAQTRVFEELSKRGLDNAGPGRIPSGGREEVIVGDDPLVHKLDGIRNAILHRAAPELRTIEGKPAFVLSDEGREYRGMSLMDIARVILNARGIRTTSMNKMDLAAAALGLEGRGGMHTTSDYANILADVQGKVLRAAYGEAPQTWEPLARRVQLPDFKTSKQLQLGDAPDLLEVLEHGEFTRGTVGESKEQFGLKTYGRVFAITRQALINDDLDAFARIPTEFARAARRRESDLAWAQITANAAMGDSVALFHADHSNLSGTSDAITVTSIGAGRTALRRQKGVDAVAFLNLVPRYLIVPATKETIADQFVSTNLVAAQSSNVNPFAGRLQVISEPRLDAVSTTAWYLAAGPDQTDILLHGVLEGNEGPMIETRVGFDVDGIEVKCRLDCAFKVADWRGLYKNLGA